MTAMNTKNIAGLEEAFNAVAEKWKVQVYSGIKNGYVNREDGLPWFEVSGTFDKTTARQFIQDLANTMNIRVLFNRLTCYPNEDVICGVLDINPDVAKQKGPNEIVPNFTNSPGLEASMNDYGQEFLPKS